MFIYLFTLACIFVFIWLFRLNYPRPFATPGKLSHALVSPPRYGLLSLNEGIVFSSGHCEIFSLHLKPIWTDPMKNVYIFSDTYIGNVLAAHFTILQAIAYEWLIVDCVLRRRPTAWSDYSVRYQNLVMWFILTFHRLMVVFIENIEYIKIKRTICGMYHTIEYTHNSSWIICCSEKTIQYRPIQNCITISILWSWFQYDFDQMHIGPHAISHYRLPILLHTRVYRNKYIFCHSAVLV